MADNEAWCVHVTGTDDVLPATSRLDAMRQAHELNATSLKIITDTEDDEYYPTMWAVPMRRADLYA